MAIICATIPRETIMPTTNNHLDPSSLAIRSMQAAGQSLADIGEMIGTAAESVADILAGNRPLTIRQKAAILDSTGASVESWAMRALDRRTMSARQKKFTDDT